MSRAIFLDRDGVILVDKGYVHKVEDAEFCPGSLEALAKLAQTDYKIITVTNQSGIGRGLYSEEQYENLMIYMKNYIVSKGGRIDASYHCPHIPSDGCLCRKPNPEMIYRAASDLHIDLSKSWMVGDKDSDILCGRSTGCKTVKIGLNSTYTVAHHYANSLREAINIIMTPK